MITEVKDNLIFINDPLNVIENEIAQFEYLLETEGEDFE